MIQPIINQSMEHNPLIDKILHLPLLRSACRTDAIRVGNEIVALDILSFLLRSADKLAVSVQFSEFTEHGLPHIYSLVKRISEWSLRYDTADECDQLVSQLEPVESFLLAFATITHDIGMLSQQPFDLPPVYRYTYAPQFVDLPSWVRITHIKRLRGLVCRILGSEEELASVVESDWYNLAVSIAESHGEWPKPSWPSEAGPVYAKIKEYAPKIGISPERAGGLAAVLAVADLLDEDYRRCDTDALLGHKQGTTLNRSHWLRHRFIRTPPAIENGLAQIELVRTKRWPNMSDAVLSTLQLHLNQATDRYNPLLRTFQADFAIEYNVFDGPDDLADSKLEFFDQAPDVHLLRAFSERILRHGISTLDGSELNYSEDESEIIRFVLDLLPLDHDAVTTFRATKKFNRFSSKNTEAESLLLMHMFEASQRGDILLAMKLRKDLQNASVE